MGLDCRASVNSGQDWQTMAMMTLSSAPQYYFDISMPLPPQRYYRAWEAGAPAGPPVVGLPFMAPALTLTGSAGDSVRVDGINQFGPTDAWFKLDTVILTNTSQ